MHRLQDRTAQLEAQVKRAPDAQTHRSTTPLQTEAQSIQTAIDALNGKQPDAALQARVKAFQTKQADGAAQELAAREQQNSSATSSLCPAADQRRSWSPI